MAQQQVRLAAGPTRPPAPIASYVWFLSIGVASVLLAAIGLLYLAFTPLPRLENAGGIAALLLTVVGLMCVGVAIGRRAGANRAEMEKWRAIGDALPFACIAVDGRGRGAYWNAHYESVLPKTNHAPLAAIKKRLGDDPTARDVLDRLSDAAARGEPLSEEAEWQDGGETRYVRLAVAPLLGADQQSLWTIQDVSSRWRLQRQYGEVRAQLADFLDRAPIGFYEADQDGRVTLMNRTLANWLGIDLDAATDVPIDQAPQLHDLLAEPAPKNTPAYQPYANASGPGWNDVVLASQPADGEAATSFPAHIDQALAYSGNPLDSRLLARAIVTNIANDQQLQGDLRVATKRFQSLFKDSPMAAALLDAQAVVTEANRAWLQTVVSPASRDTATDGEDSEPADYWDNVLEADREKFQSWLNEAMSTPGVHAPLSLRLNPSPGEEKPGDVMFFVSRIDAEDGSLESLVLQVHDARQAAAMQFTQGQKMQAVGQLAGGVAHDFNNLLTAMIGFCDLLLNRHLPGDPDFGDIMQIKQNANRAANLVRQLLAFSRQQTMRPTVLSVSDALADLDNLLRRLIGADVKLELVHGRDIGLIRVDQGQLEQVIINLAVNARDAMPDGGKLTISTREVSFDETTHRDDETVVPGDYVIVAIADTGTGMTAETRERIFEPFFTTKDVGEGTGLGMSTVYGIIKQTGGHIFVDSEMGEGTTFEIMLPVAPEGDIEAAAREETTRDLIGAGTVLLVEDEDAVRLFGGRALRDKGYTVIEAADGPMALDLLAEHGQPVDLMITDVMMPEMDGPTLVREVRGIYPDTKVICMSGYAEDAFREDLGNAADISFLPKPFSLQDLAAKVKEVMDE